MKHVFVIPAILLSFLQLIAAEDKVADKLDAAKSTYDKAVALAKGRLSADLQKAADQAQKKGDKATADLIRAEQKAFKTAGALPQSVPLTSYRQSTLNAANRLASEYVRAIKAYTKQNDRKTADKLETELKDLQRIHNRFWRHPAGYFIRIDNATWEELTPDQTHFTFTEVDRTLDYVELERSGGRVKVRLYSDRCDVSDRPFSSTKTFYQGEWTVE